LTGTAEVLTSGGIQGEEQGTGFCEEESGKGVRQGVHAKEQEDQTGREAVAIARYQRVQGSTSACGEAQVFVQVFVRSQFPAARAPERAAEIGTGENQIAIQDSTAEGQGGKF
jgi:hypothetical protein